MNICFTDAHQVFELLETIYGALDKVAKKRRIFKVETVGYEISLCLRMYDVLLSFGFLINACFILHFSATATLPYVVSPRQGPTMQLQWPGLQRSV
jgi:hypothetical protein